MNNYDNFFNNLLPLRHLYPFVQSVLPTVFDDSLSYLETLGKVVKALNDTETNVNTLEQAVRAFADDLSLYGNLTISPVEITFNQDTGRYSASMAYADIVSAINEGHTMVLHVVDGLHGAEYYTATIKVAETGNGVKVLYWESPAFTVNDVTVFYEAFINENDTVGVTTRTITGSGSDAFIIHYNSDTVTADKTFAEIVAAIEAEKTVMLFADNFFISNARWTTSGNDDIGYEIISVQFNAFNVVTAQSGKNLGCVTYAVDNADTWTVTRNGFPNESRVNALIDVKLAQLEGFNNIIILDYVESTGAVTYWDGEQTVNATGQYILNHLIDLASPQLLVLRGVQNHGVGMDTLNIYLPVEWGQTTGAWFIDFYRVYDGNVELVRIPYATNIVTKTTTPIGGGSVTDAVLYTQQSLTDVQKEQARANIDAISDSDLQYVTPQMFGAVGDGLTDDTNAFNAAQNSGKNVFVPEGEYVLTNFVFSTSITWVFQRAKSNPWFIDDGGAKILTATTTKITKGPKIYNLCIKYNGTEAETANRPVCLQMASYYCEIHGFWESGWYIGMDFGSEVGTGAGYTKIYDAYCWYNYFCGVRLAASNTAQVNFVSFYDCNFGSNGMNTHESSVAPDTARGYGIYIATANSIAINNADVSANETCGIYLDADTIEKQTRGLFVSSIYGEHNKYCDIYYNNSMWTTRTGAITISSPYFSHTSADEFFVGEVYVKEPYIPPCVNINSCPKSDFIDKSCLMLAMIYGTTKSVTSMDVTNFAFFGIAGNTYKVKLRLLGETSGNVTFQDIVNSAKYIVPQFVYEFPERLGALTPHNHAVVAGEYTDIEYTVTLPSTTDPTIACYSARTYGAKAKVVNGSIEKVTVS